jgi:hypothetical protein
MSMSRDICKADVPLTPLQNSATTPRMSRIASLLAVEDRARRDGILLSAPGALPTDRRLVEGIGVGAAAARAVRLAAVCREPDALELIESLIVGYPQNCSDRQPARGGAEQEVLRQGANPCVGTGLAVATVEIERQLDYSPPNDHDCRGQSGSLI